MARRNFLAAAINNLGSHRDDARRSRRKPARFSRGPPVLASEIGDRMEEAVMLSNIGYILDYPRQIREALDYDNQAIAVFLETGQLAMASSMTSNIGGIYQELGQFQKMLDACLKALELLKTVNDDRCGKEMSWPISRSRKTARTLRQGARLLRASRGFSREGRRSHR